MPVILSECNVCDRARGGGGGKAERLKGPSRTGQRRAMWAAWQVLEDVWQADPKHDRGDWWEQGALAEAVPVG